MSKKYITTAIPYVNGVPHIGHAMDYCIADACARYYKLVGDDVRLQAGTDEHGNKIFLKAKQMGVPINDYVSENAQKFKDFIHELGVSYTDFVRTTDTDHERRCQEIWRRLKDHIYLARYEGWYCTGCERYVTMQEYEENNGICPDHQKPYERLEEENYYFRIADFKDRIKLAIETDEVKILPEFRKKEVLKMLEDSPDVSISRPTSQLTWGIPVPDDDSQVMYVWIDALANYITVLGYPDEDVSDWWPAEVQVVGKDILRFHAIIWPAMLMGLGLPLPKKLLSHGMVLSDGQKMSKSIGNVVDPMDVLKRHGVDAFRYFFLRHVDTFLDSDFTWQKFEDAYNNELANDLGNLVQRVATLAQKNQIKYRKEPLEVTPRYNELMGQLELSKAFDVVWERIKGINRKIDEEKPWSLAKNGKRDELEKCMNDLITDLLGANLMLEPFLPSTAQKIREIFQAEISLPETPLFPKRKES